MNREQFFNLQLEADILAIALNNRNSLDYIVDIKEDAFYNANHKAIYQVIKALYTEGKEVTVATVMATVGSNTQVIGGITTLMDIAASYTTSQGLKHLLEKLKEVKKRRDLFNVKVKMDKMFAEEKENSYIIKEINDDLDNLNEKLEDDGAIDPVLSELMILIEDKYNNGGKITGIETKIYELDKKLNGLNKQELTIIAGRPGSGKTTLANNIGLRAAAQGKHVVVFNLEMSKIQIFQKLLANVGMIDNEHLKFGNLTDKEWEKVAEGQAKLSKLGKNMKIFDSILHIDRMVAQCRKLHKQNKLDLVIIDYIQLIETNKGNNREQEVSSISRTLKQLTKSLNIPIIALSQLSRAPEQRADHRPIMSDLRESGAIEQDSENILFCYRDEYYNAETEDKNIMEIIIGKNRNGSTGTVKAAWIPQYQKVSDLFVR